MNLNFSESNAAEEQMKKRLAQMNQAIANQEYIIGFDLGNSNSYLCFVQHADMKTGRLGGIVHSLLPPNYNQGIPSVYFHAESERCRKHAERIKKPLPWCGADAVMMAATPRRNRKKLLKRHLGEHFTVDGKSIAYDDAIVKVVEYCVRTANKQLQETMLTTTNLVSLSYPATYTCAQRERLIELVERATLADGKTHVKVFGTITEPAAAALDYLADCAKGDADTTVLTYDLGGGTFDMALVAAYPKGRKNALGGTYYYDVIDAGGIADLGGAEFDEEMYKLLVKKIGQELTEEQEYKVRDEAERTKITLSDEVVSWPALESITDEEIEVTRAEFEKAVAGLIQKTVDATGEFMKLHEHQKPDMILLTGGASQVPAIKKALEKAFPQYAKEKKIQIFRPAESIACGAARFGTVELAMDPVEVKPERGRKMADTEAETPRRDKSTSIIQRRVSYDIGVRFHLSSDNDRLFIRDDIKAGTPIPYEGPQLGANASHDGQQFVDFAVYEAKKLNPDSYKVTEDYTEIMKVRLNLGRTYNKSEPCSKYRLSIDHLGRLVIEAWDITKPGNPPIKCEVELKNLSKGGQ